MRFKMKTVIEKCALFVLMVVLKLIEAICYLHSVKYYLMESKRCPPISNKLLLQSASQLSEQIRNRMISSEEVIRAYISRIRKVNSVLNAVANQRFELALQEAKSVDNMLRDTKYSVIELQQKYPLLGVPITIKESIPVKGLTNSAGMVDLKDTIAKDDADVVKLIKSSGAIILLVSTTPELCLSIETLNNVTGTTSNPYDTRKTPGGSSGGEAALISSGASLIGIGSDLIGSVRIPASFCGIWGHKPTAKIVPIKGHYPYCDDTHFASTLSLGPLTRYFSDLSLLFSVMLEEEKKSLLLLDTPVSLKGVKIYVLNNDSSFFLSKNVEPEILFAIKKLVNHLEVNYLCETQVIKVTQLRRSIVPCFKIITSFKGFSNIFENNPKGYYKELLLYLLGKSNYTLIHIFLAIVKSLYLQLPNDVTEKAYAEILTIKNNLSNTLGTNGVLILPTHPTAANFHSGVYGKLYDCGYTSIFNLIGFPATQCPIGLNSQGLPIGLQVVAVTNNDRLTLRVAEEVNKLYGGWIPPPFS